ncbi:hypothetical protein HYT26_01445 [Candidatus Pacearchaeota archaeon]|nr:hypothetical protein [Candidatus Pacearchaeota archaeon]
MKWLICVLVGLVTLIISIWMGVMMGYTINRDTTSWLIRAQVASNPTDMLEYLKNCENGMKNLNLTEGYASLIFKKPETDMRLIMKSLSSSIERAKNVQKMKPSSTEYQVALDDLRGTLRELDLYSPQRWNTKVWFLNILIPVFWILTFILGFYAETY